MDTTRKPRVEFPACGVFAGMTAGERIQTFEQSVLVPALDEISASPALYAWSDAPFPGYR
jgi:hypothetical protein